MAAVFLKEEKIFKLDTRNTTYVIAAVDDEQFLGHVYYGKKLKEVHLDGLLRSMRTLLSLQGTTGTGYPSLTAFRWNTRHTDLEITEKAVSVSAQRKEMWDLPFLMYHIRSRREKMDLKVYRHPLEKQESVRRWRFFARIR